MMKYGIILFCLILGGDIWTDYAKWADNYTPINHTLEAIIRMVLLVPSGFLLAGYVEKNPLRIHFHKYWWQYGLITAGMMGSVYWVCFDSVYNMLRGFDWLFNGSVDGGDSKLDLFLMKLKDWQEALLKLGLCAVFIFLYIKFKLKWQMQKQIGGSGL